MVCWKNSTLQQIVHTFDTGTGRSTALTMFLGALTGSTYTLYSAISPLGWAGGPQVMYTSGELVTLTEILRGGEGPIL